MIRLCQFVRHVVKTKAPLRVQYLMTFWGTEGGKEQEASALLREPAKV